MSSKPRTPRYWPHMKVRGARRKQMREGSIQVLLKPDIEAFVKAFDGFTIRAVTTLETLANIQESITKEHSGEH